MTRAMGTKNKQRARSSGGSDTERARSQSKEPARSLSKERLREAERAAIVGQVGDSPTPAELAAAQARAKAAMSSSAAPQGAPGASSAAPEVVSVAAAAAGATMAPKAAPVPQKAKPAKAAPAGAWVAGITPPVAASRAPVTPPKAAAVPVAQEPVPETPPPASAQRPAVSFGPPSPVAASAPDTTTARASGVPAAASAARPASAHSVGPIFVPASDDRRPPVAAAFLADPHSAEFLQCMNSLHSVLAVLARCDELLWRNLQRLVAHTTEHQIRWELDRTGPHAQSALPGWVPGNPPTWMQVASQPPPAAVQPRPAVMQPRPKTKPMPQAPSSVSPQQHEPKVASILRRGSFPAPSRPATPGPAPRAGRLMQVLDPSRPFVTMENPSGGLASPPRPTVIMSEVTDRPRGARRRSLDARRPRSRSVGARRSQRSSCTEPCPDCHFGLCGRPVDPDPTRSPHDKHWSSICKAERQAQGRWPPTTP